MKYKCENEISTLSFKDFGLVDIDYNDERLLIVTDGGIAKYDNSCNETLEERYIGEAQIRIIDAMIEDFYLEGGKYFDADDNLIEVYPDQPITHERFKAVFKKIKAEESEARVFFVGEKHNRDEMNTPSTGDEEAKRHMFEIAIDAVNDTYWIKVSGKKIVVEFDRFMNRVMQ